MNWTPGPWKVNEFGFVHANKVLISVPPGEEADVSFACYPGSEQFKANARLIALAPELAEALRRIHTWLICPALDRDTVQEMQTLAGNVLAKLEGGGK